VSTVIPKMWSLKDLNPSQLTSMLTTRVADPDDVSQHRSDVLMSKKSSADSNDLFSMFSADTAKVPSVLYEERDIIYATDNYAAKGEGYGEHDPVRDVSIIKPRVEKSKAEQKARVKGKAEVFTPVWLVNAQLNLADDHAYGEGIFNTVDPADKTSWVNSERAYFGEDNDLKWLEYVSSPVLEITCGEGPYMFTPYDATSGTYLPVRTAEGQWNRVGMLDRKFRVIAENIDDLELWEKAALVAMRSVHGYEWQGDNLLLARMNMVNTYFDYLYDFIVNVLGDTDAKIPVKYKFKSRLDAIIELVSWQLWQMDGIRQVSPMSCSETCKKCKKASNSTGHDGLLPVLKWGGKVITFEDMILLNQQDKTTKK
jgi:hypothetical protein